MFGGGNSGLSVADIAAVCKNADADGFGGNSGWWILIILWALWGRNGLGDNNAGNCNDSGNQGGGSVTYQFGSDIQRGFDTQAIISKLDGLNSGLCSLGYDQLAQMNSLNNTVQQSAFNVQQAINNLSTSELQSFNSVLNAIQSCCCGTKEQISDLKYTGAKNASDIVNAITQAAQNIVQNDNANYRQLHDEIVENRIQDMRDQISQKDTMINMLNLSRSQENQTVDIVNQVISRLRDCPVGTYNVCNPNSCNTQLPTLQQIAQLLQNAGNYGCNGQGF